MKRESLSCGCFVEIDEERDLGRLFPCSDRHKAIAEALRRPGSRYVVLPVGQAHA